MSQQTPIFNSGRQVYNSNYDKGTSNVTLPPPSALTMTPASSSMVRAPPMSEYPHYDYGAHRTYHRQQSSLPAPVPSPLQLNQPLEPTHVSPGPNRGLYEQQRPIMPPTTPTSYDHPRQEYTPNRPTEPLPSPSQIAPRPYWTPGSTSTTTPYPAPSYSQPLSPIKSITNPQYSAHSYPQSHSPTHHSAPPSAPALTPVSAPVASPSSSSYTPAQAFHRPTASPPSKPSASMKINSMLTSDPIPATTPTQPKSPVTAVERPRPIAPVPPPFGAPTISPSPYSLILRQQPIAARSCGFGERDRRVIDPPPILEMHIAPSANPGNSSPLASQHADFHAVVHCNIWNAAGTQETNTMSEEQRPQRRLMGTLVASPFTGVDDHGVPGTFFCFPDLSVRTPGVFRLRFSLVIIDPRRSTARRFPLQAQAMSDKFTVFNAKEFPGMRRSTPLTRKLKDQGCLISLKKGTDRDRSSRASDDEDQGRRRNNNR